MDIQVAAIETSKWSWSKFGTILCFALAAALLLTTLINDKAKAQNEFGYLWTATVSPA